tara:strand:+ start:303 stop:875 length:573 start_codon:yes stop_codon:yes gene_type:complete
MLDEAFIQFCAKYKYNLVLNKDGSIMKNHPQNKKIFKFYEKVLSRNQENNETTVKEFDCVICMETIQTNTCILECGHQFCVVCFALHMRENGNCPLCREKIIEPPRKKNHGSMPIDTINTMMLNEYLARYQDRGNLNLPNYVRSEINTLLYNSQSTNQIMCVDNIATEIYRFGHDLIERVNMWHENSHIF